MFWFCFFFVGVGGFAVIWIYSFSFGLNLRGFFKVEEVCFIVRVIFRGRWRSWLERFDVLF